MKLYQCKTNDPAPIAQADPYMIKADDGRYYMYSSGAHLFESSHLLDGWEYKGICLDMAGQKNCWAPCVIEIGGKYYMYYSSMDEDADDEHDQTMRVAVADSPHGPFGNVKKLMPPFSIDPHVVRNGTGLYLFYCHNITEAERVGTYVYCDKMTDPFTMEGKPACVIAPSLDEEIYQRNRFKEGEHWHTIEGAFYFYADGLHYLMYSGANHTNPTYFIGYCVAHGPEDADLRTLDWKKYPDNSTYAPLLCKNDFVEGMGHNSVIFDEGKCYIVYHGRDVGDLEKVPGDSRSARIDEMKIDGEKLSVAPTK